MESHRSKAWKDPEDQAAGHNETSPGAPNVQLGPRNLVSIVIAVIIITINHHNRFDSDSYCRRHRVGQPDTGPWQQTQLQINKKPSNADGQKKKRSDFAPRRRFSWADSCACKAQSQRAEFNGRFRSGALQTDAQKCAKFSEFELQSRR